jgi:hypothetical protein
MNVSKNLTIQYCTCWGIVALVGTLICRQIVNQGKREQQLTKVRNAQSIALVISNLRMKYKSLNTGGWQIISHVV